MLEIGAMTRQRELEFSDVVKARWPIMHEALLQVGHRQTRNRGTIAARSVISIPRRSWCRSRPAMTRRLTVVGPNGHRELASPNFPSPT